MCCFLNRIQGLTRKLTKKLVTTQEAFFVCQSETTIMARYVRLPSPWIGNRYNSSKEYENVFVVIRFYFIIYGDKFLGRDLKSSFMGFG